MKKQITIYEAVTKYGIVVSKMQRLDKVKFYLMDNGNVMDSFDDMRYIAPKKSLKAEKKLKDLLYEMLMVNGVTSDTEIVIVEKYLPKIKKAFGKMYAEAQK